MAFTTTFELISANYLTLLEQATPYELVQHALRRGPRDKDLREWAKQAGSAAFRKFEIRRGDLDLEDPESMGVAVRELEEEMVITIAYPVLPALYGTGELDDLENVMRSDATLIRDVVYDGHSYLVGQSGAKVKDLEPDRGDDRCWFQSYSVVLTYSEAQTIF